MRLQISKKVFSTISSSDIISILLANRGIEKKASTKYLQPTDPRLFSLADLGITKAEFKRVADRLKKADTNQESVVIYGDYDVDGICATAILWDFFNTLGFKIMPHLPNRQTEGYGFSETGIEKVIAQYQPSLIIAVDHGISGEKYISLLKKKKIDVLVIDHHLLLKELKSESGVIYTQKVCAAALAYYFVKELSADYPGFNQEKLTNYLVLGSIATVTDIMPLQSINRSLVHFGLQKINQTTLAGLHALLKVAGIGEKNKYSTYDIGFIIGPRINAVGRIDDPIKALRLLCTKNPVKAQELSRELNLKNQERQIKVVEQLKIAEKLAQAQSNRKFKFIYSSEFDEGIIGLLAGKLVEKYACPVLVATVGNGYYKGSARSIDGINISALFKKTKSYLINYGGHAKAAGFSLLEANRNKFFQTLSRLVNEYADELFTKAVRVDLQLPLNNIHLTLAQKISQLEPFGEGNPEPIFASEKVKIENLKKVGKNGNHLQFYLTDDSISQPIKAVYFNGQNKLQSGSVVNLIYGLLIDRWGGQEKVTLNIKEIF